MKISKVSEKTFELNFCSSLNFLHHNWISWIGLTQKQESQFGFDALARHLCGPFNLFVLQFKVIARSIRKRDNAFIYKTASSQLSSLIRVADGRKRFVYYVLSLIVSPGELFKLKLPNPPVVIFDVTDIQGRLSMKQDSHTIEYIPSIDPAFVRIKSEIKKVPIIPFSKFIGEIEKAGSDMVRQNLSYRVGEGKHLFGRGRAMGIYCPRR